jgi:hypothetical protein
MEKINLHQKKLFAIIEAALAFIGLLLAWTVETTYNGQSSSQNGFRSWGWLCLLAILGVFIISIIGEKHRDFDKNSKLIALGCFAAIVLGAVLYLIALNSAENQQNKLFEQQLYQQGYQVQRGFTGYSANAGPGLWMTLTAGVIGLAWVSGILDRFNKVNQAPATAQQTATTTTTTTPLPQQPNTINPTTNTVNPS